MLSMPRLRWYADAPLRRARQVASDVLALVWFWGCYQVGTAVHAATSELAAPGRRLEEAGAGLGRNLSRVGETAVDIPFVGDRLRGPFDQAGTAADSIRAAGVQQQEVVADLALLLGLVVALVPAVIVLGLWLPLRIRFARRAAAAQQLIDAAADLDLFALRAMTSQPMHVLARVSDDPAGAWRRGDPAVIRQLAVLELRDAGLRPPAALG